MGRLKKSEAAIAASKPVKKTAAKREKKNKDNNLLLAIGGYSTEGTAKDLNISHDCIHELRDYMQENNPVEGYKYEVMNNVSMDVICRRCNLSKMATFSDSKITPGLPILVLRNETNPDDFYIVVAGDDKQQQSSANAIERVFKNFNAFWKFGDVMDIVPYVLFLGGKGFYNANDGSINSCMLGKLQSGIPTLHLNGVPYMWSPDIKKSSSKNEWNRCYIQPERYTRAEKYSILLDVALNSVKFYKQHFNIG